MRPTVSEWLRQALIAEEARPVDRREVAVASAFPAIFILVGIIAQIAIGAALVLYGVQGDWSEVPRLALAQILVVLAFLLGWGCARHYQSLLRRLKIQAALDIERDVALAGRAEGTWPPAPRLDDGTDRLNS
ncbi:MAG: hypothetical protein P4L33_17915 [Capsulimonadaceae bacterium]|nr:hypothetical protein [Capsulimonadaceae bacterium]